MLLIIPFITKIGQIISPWSSKLSSIINRLDEGTILIFFLLAIKEFYNEYKNVKEPALLYFILLCPIFFLSIAGFISGMINGNDLMITTLGTFAYIKFFIVIFIYAAFFKDFNIIQKIFRILLIVAVFIGVVAFFQEVWVICGRLFIDKDIPEKGFYMFISKLLGVSDVNISGSGWRLGVYRASSLLSHYNLLGLYSLFILTVYLHIKKKVNFAIIFPLLTGIAFSVSRTAYAGFVLLSGLQIFNGRRWLIVFLIPCVIALFYMGVFGNEFNVSEIKSEELQAENQISITYREFARQKAMQVWKDHPVWGVGPGMFGGAVAFKYRSYLYEAYDFNFIYNWFHSLDQLWPQVLAEMGIVGTAALAGFFISLFSVMYIARKRATSYEIRGLFAGLLTFTIIFLFYTLSGNLNIVSILFPFCAFVGMGLGCAGIGVLKRDIE